MQAHATTHICIFTCLQHLKAEACLFAYFQLGTACVFEKKQCIYKNTTWTTSNENLWIKTLNNKYTAIMYIRM